MTTRKTKVRLVRAPLSGNTDVLTNYTELEGGVLKVRAEGKHNVSEDYDVLVLTDLIGAPGDPENTKVMDMLAAVADGDEDLSIEASDAARRLYKRLDKIIDRHNARVAEQEGD